MTEKTGSGHDDSTIIIYGVRHDDERNTEKILNRTPSTVGAVCHEQVCPDEQQSHHFLLWAFATPSTALRVILEHTGNPSRYSECQKAAQALASREGVDVTYIGMRYLERAKVVFPTHTLVWFPTVYALAQPFIPLLGGILLSVLMTIFGMPLTERHENKYRDTHLANEIISQTTPSARTVAIIGETHLSSVGRKIAEEGYQPQEIPLHSELDE